MSDRRLNNSIFLMYLASKKYMDKHNITVRQFDELDARYAVLNYIFECPDIFDNMTDEEMVSELDQYVTG